MSAAFARTKPPKGKRSGEAGVCVYAISGGTGAHMADMASAAGLRLPDLTKKTQAALHDGLIPSYLRVSNPVDCGGPPVMTPAGRKILDAIVADKNVDILIVPITGALESMSAPMVRDLVAVAETTDKPIFVVWGSPVGTEPAYVDGLLQEPAAGVPHLRQLRARGARLPRLLELRRPLRLAVRRRADQAARRRPRRRRRFSRRPSPAPR